MRLECRIVKLERQRAAEGSHPFDRMSSEQVANMARAYLRALDAAELNPDDTPTRQAMELLGIEPDGLKAWIRDQA